MTARPALRLNSARASAVAALGRGGRVFAAAAAAVEPFWVFALVVVQLHLVPRLVPYTGEKLEWAQYLLLGTLFPAVLVGLCLAKRYARPAAPVVALIQLAVAGWAAYLIANSVTAATASAVSSVWLLLVTVLVVARDPSPGPNADRPWWPSTPAVLVWAAVFTLAVSGWHMHPFPTLALPGGGYAFAVVAATAAIGAAALLRPAAGGRAAGLRRAADVAVVAAIGWACFHCYPPAAIPGQMTPEVFHTNVTWHHWGAVIGPAEVVRSGGGWLLWDTPSQYGVLNTLILSRLPAANMFQSLYLFNATLAAATLTFLFALFRSARPGWGGYPFALAVALGALLIDGGSWFYTPSYGPLRYFWCYALGAVLWAGLREADRGGPPSRRLLAGGCAAWLAGLAWSFESAVYVTVIWAPAFTILAATRARADGAGTGRVVGRTAAWCALPPALAAATWAGVTAWYHARLGHGPDWSGYAEFVLSFSKGFGAVPVSPLGSVWVPLAAFGALAAVLAVAAGAAGCRGAHLAAVAGALGLVWAPLSYYVNMSHESTVIVLLPLVLAALGVGLHVVERGAVPARAGFPLRVGLIAIVAFVAATAYQRVTKYTDSVAGLLRTFAEPPSGHVAGEWPAGDPALDYLLAAAGVRPTDPVVHLDFTSNLNPLPFRRDEHGRACAGRYPAWLPLASANVYIPLPPDRVAEYLDRYLAHRRVGGWLVRNRGVIGHHMLEQVVLRAVGKTHRVTRSVQTETWLVEWYEPLAD